jgi:hypothetical protein
MKKLLALLLLFGIVGCSQSELERCIDANSRFKELTLDMFYVNDYDEIDLLPKSILDLDIILNNELEEDYRNAYIEFVLKNYPATKQNSDYLGICWGRLEGTCNLEEEINKHNEKWSKPNEITTMSLSRYSEVKMDTLLGLYAYSVIKTNMNEETLEENYYYVYVELLQNNFYTKYLDYNIEVNNIPKLIKGFNDDAIKNDRLNATGICNAQGIY